MPLFLVEAPPISDLERDVAVRLAAQRFPEIVLEQHYAEHDGGGRDVWVCRAPNEDQLTRWAAAAALTLGEVRRVDPLEINKQRKAQT
jgi:hypothetical protein